MKKIEKLELERQISLNDESVSIGPPSLLAITEKINEKINDRISDITHKLIELYDRSNGIYEVINGVDLKEMDFKSPYYIKAKEIIAKIDCEVKILKQERDALIEEIEKYEEK